LRGVLGAHVSPFVMAFRRTVATDFHENGVPLQDIADQLGHKDASMTAQVYLGHDFGASKKHLPEYV